MSVYETKIKLETTLSDYQMHTRAGPGLPALASCVSHA